MNNGTSHIHDLVAGLDKVSSRLGCGSQQLNDPSHGTSDLLADIRQLVLSIQTRDQSITALQASVDVLSTKINGDPGITSSMSVDHLLREARSDILLDVEIIADMIDRQHRAQESLFRSLTNGTKTCLRNRKTCSQIILMQRYLMR